jgi:dynein heavy chain, axonemal
VLVTKGRRWPLMIDPQMQANMWIRKMEGELDSSKLHTIEPSNEKMYQVIKNSISQGHVVILQNIDEDLDP